MLNTSTPILFLMFNRPDLALKSFTSIRDQKPKQLFLASDGARDGVHGEKELVSQCRTKIEAAIDWPCQVFTLYQEKNLGCGQALYQAISWFFDQVEEGIIIEDDVETQPAFFDFMRKGLAQYKHNERVGLITANNHFEMAVNGHFKSHFGSVWGWATWRNRWEGFALNCIDQTMPKEELQKRFDFETAKAFNWFINQVKSQKINTWDYQWRYYNALKGRRAIVPFQSLVRNIGFAHEGATHTNQVDFYHLITRNRGWWRFVMANTNFYDFLFHKRSRKTAIVQHLKDYGVYEIRKKLRWLKKIN